MHGASSCLFSSRLLSLQDKLQIREDNSQHLFDVCCSLDCITATVTCFHWLVISIGTLTLAYHHFMSLLLHTAVFRRGSSTTNTLTLIVKDDSPLCSLLVAFPPSFQSKILASRPSPTCFPLCPPLAGLVSWDRGSGGLHIFTVDAFSGVFYRPVLPHRPALSLVDQ